MSNILLAPAWQGLTHKATCRLSSLRSRVFQGYPQFMRQAAEKTDQQKRKAERA
jgi:hypothetical protein